MVKYRKEEYVSVYVKIIIFDNRNLDTASVM